MSTCDFQPISIFTHTIPFWVLGQEPHMAPGIAAQWLLTGEEGPSIAASQTNRDESGNTGPETSDTQMLIGWLLGWWIDRLMMANNI